MLKSASMDREHQVLNLGCVVYRQINDGLEAEWMQLQDESKKKGTGKAKRLGKAEAGQPYEGSFEIIYEDDAGHQSPKLHLSIVRCREGYELTWRQGQQVTERGIGFVSEDRLIASFQAL